MRCALAETGRGEEQGGRDLPPTRYVRSRSGSASRCGPGAWITPRTGVREGDGHGEYGTVHGRVHRGARRRPEPRAGPDIRERTRGAAQRALVPTRGLPHQSGERVDEGAGICPSTRCRRVHHGEAVSEQQQSTVDAQLDAPLAEAHARGLLEEAAEGALAGPDPSSELLERGRVLHVVLDEMGEFPEALVTGLGKVQRLLRGGGELIDDDPPQPVPTARGSRSVAGQGEGGLARESAVTASTEGCAGRSSATASAMNTMRMSVAPCARCWWTEPAGIQAARFGGAIQEPSSVTSESTPLAG